MYQPVPGVRMLDRTWGSNIYLVNGERPVLIDAGFPLDEKRILKALEGKSPGLIVATHYHIDHIGPVSRLNRRFGCPVAAHADDAPVIEGRSPYEVYRLDPLRAAYYRVLSPLYRYENVTVDMVLEEDDVIDALGGLEVIHIPGHTAGSIALYQRSRGILFTGDSVRNERGVLEGPPPRFSSSIEEAFMNLRRKVIDLDFEILLPGHGCPITVGARDAVERMMREYGRLD